MLKENEIKEIRKNCKILSDETSKAYKEYTLLCKSDADEKELDSKFVEYLEIAAREKTERQKLILENIVP